MGEARWTAVAHPNIALVKYWGKRDERLNLPAVGSISITLNTLQTVTTIEENISLNADQFLLDGKAAPSAQVKRVQAFLDIFRKHTGEKRFFVVNSTNNFPTGAGLASSASGFAALAMAANAAFGTPFSPRELSTVARQGSGSAARSIFGGWVEMHRGQAADGSDAFAEPLLSPSEWPLSVLVCVTSHGVKSTGSTEGMKRTAATSPYYAAWVTQQDQDLQAMRQAIHQRDFAKVADIAEFSCLKMHGLMLSARPGLLYWNGTTVDIIHRVRQLRREGIPAFFTIDAGPQVKVICPPDSVQDVEFALSEIKGIHTIYRTGLGEGARLIDNSV